jgi:hypothetical protein
MMASSHEKAARGVDPNEGWGKPTLRDRLLCVLILAIVVPLVWGGPSLALWRAFGGGN